MGDCISWCNPVFKRVEKLPHVRQATRNHTYILPNGERYILNADGSGFESLVEAKIVDIISEDNTIIVAKTENGKTTTFNVKVSDEIIGRITTLENKPDNDTIYDDTALVNRVSILENKEDRDTTYTAGDGIILEGTTIRLNRASLNPDKYVKDVAVSRRGKKITLNYTYTDDTMKSVEFDDEDTVTLAYDDTALRNRVEALENKPDNDTIYDDTDIKARIKTLESKPDKDTTYSAGTGIRITDSGEIINTVVDTNTTYTAGNNITITGDNNAINGYKAEFIESDGVVKLRITTPDGQVTERDIPHGVVKGKDITITPNTEETSTGVETLVSVTISTPKGDIKVYPPTRYNIKRGKEGVIYTLREGNTLNATLVDGNDLNGSSFYIPHDKLNLSAISLEGRKLSGHRHMAIKIEGRHVMEWFKDGKSVYSVAPFSSFEVVSESMSTSRIITHHIAHNGPINMVFDIRILIEGGRLVNGKKDSILYFEPVYFIPHFIPSKFEQKGNNYLWQTHMSYLKHKPITGETVTWEYPTKPNNQYPDYATYRCEHFNLKLSIRGEWVFEEINL